MHEMGIAMQIVDIATASLPADNTEVRVKKVNLKIGRLAAVIPASLRFCFEVITKETPFSDAQLNITEVPVVVRCRTCDAQWQVDGPDFTCETCPKGSVDIVSGREIEIISLEVAD